MRRRVQALEQAHSADHERVRWLIASGDGARGTKQHGIGGWRSPLTGWHSREEHKMSRISCTMIYIAMICLCTWTQCTARSVGQRLGAQGHRNMRASTVCYLSIIFGIPFPRMHSRAVQCDGCPTEHCGRGRYTWWGVSPIQTKNCAFMAIPFLWGGSDQDELA